MSAGITEEYPLKPGSGITEEYPLKSGAGINAADPPIT